MSKGLTKFCRLDLDICLRVWFVIWFLVLTIRAEGTVRGGRALWNSSRSCLLALMMPGQATLHALMNVRVVAAALCALSLMNRIFRFLIEC